MTVDLGATLHVSVHRNKMLCFTGSESWIERQD